MTRIVPATLVAIVTAVAVVDAHRLDELLQAARVAISPASVVIHLDLTPGVALAPDTLARLDADGDGRVAPLEAEAYARGVMADLEAWLDGIRLPLSLRRVEIPAAEEMHDGVGTLQLELAGATGRHQPGRHIFELRNRHRPEQSAYLANALMPDGAEVTILRQQRDPTQQVYRLHFEVPARHDTSAAMLWLLGGIAVLLALVRFRVGSDRRSKRPEPALPVPSSPVNA